MTAFGIFFTSSCGSIVSLSSFPLLVTFDDRLFDRPYTSNLLGICPLYIHRSAYFGRLLGHPLCLQPTDILVDRCSMRLLGLLSESC